MSDLRMIEDVVPQLSRVLCKEGYVVAAMALQQAARDDADEAARLRRRVAALESRLARVLGAAESWRWSVSVYQGSEQRGGRVWSGRAARGAKR